MIENKTTSVVLRLPKELKDYATFYSRQAQTSLSEFIRKAIEKEIIRAKARNK
jgi:predicted DNA-binding protein